MLQPSFFHGCGSLGIVQNGRRFIVSNKRERVPRAIKKGEEVEATGNGQKIFLHTFATAAEADELEHLGRGWK